MINPSGILKLIGVKNKFMSMHPKFSAFVEHLIKNGIAEGSVIEITVTGPDGEAVTSNMKVTQDDIAMFQEIAEAVSSER